MSDRILRGVLVAVRDAPLDSEEAWLLSALADQAAISLGNARLHEQLLAREADLRNEVERSQTLAGELEALIYTVAHDLRAPLRAMTGCGELLVEEYGDRFEEGRGRDYLLRIASGARRMDALIHDLLTYSHLAKSEMDLEAVDVDTAVSEALGDLKGEIERRQAAVTREPSPLRVLAHWKTLVRILENLISNALKFVEVGRAPVVEVKAELQREFVRISVRDNGIGISEAYLERIFGVFERLNRAEDFPGTGIGLAVVRRGVERMGGVCGVESRPGQGSLFWIALRRA